jgi:pyridoxine 4-dehydrogenase
MCRPSTDASTWSDLLACGQTPKQQSRKTRRRERQRSNRTYGNTFALSVVAMVISGVSGYTPSPFLGGAVAPRTAGRVSTAARRDTTRIGTLTVPKLGIGTIAWTPTDAKRSRIPLPGDRVANVEADALEELRRNDLVQQACAAGLNFVDTAERYSVGQGETMAADAVRRSGSSGVIATKFTPTPWRTEASDVVQACRDSRERLGVEQIDLYQIHMPDIVQPGRAFGYVNNKDKVYWEGLAQCYELGLVKNIGVSNYGPTLLREVHAFMAARGIPLASNQFNFSLLYRRQGAQATLDACNELGVAAMAYMPVCMGLLTDKYVDGAPEPASFFDLKGRTMKNYVDGGSDGVPAGGVTPVLRALRAIADARGKSVAQIAINYVIAKGAIPVVGMMNPSQLESNAGALGWRLTAAEVATLEAEADALPFEFMGTLFKRASSKFVGYGVEEWRLD